MRRQTDVVVGRLGEPATRSTSSPPRNALSESRYSFKHIDRCFDFGWTSRIGFSSCCCRMRRRRDSITRCLSGRRCYSRPRGRSPFRWSIVHCKAGDADAGRPKSGVWPFAQPANVRCPVSLSNNPVGGRRDTLFLMCSVHQFVVPGLSAWDDGQIPRRRRRRNLSI